MADDWRNRDLARMQCVEFVRRTAADDWFGLKSIFGRIRFQAIHFYEKFLQISLNDFYKSNFKRCWSKVDGAQISWIIISRRCDAQQRGMLKILKTFRKVDLLGWFSGLPVWGGCGFLWGLLCVVVWGEVDVKH